MKSSRSGTERLKGLPSERRRVNDWLKGSNGAAEGILAEMRVY